MREAAGHPGSVQDGDRNHQPGDVGFCSFVCAARPLRNGVFCSLLCFAAGVGLITFGVVTYIGLSRTNPRLAWQRFFYISIGAITIVTGVVSFGRVYCLYRSFRRHQEQTAQNVALQGNLDPQQPQVWVTEQATPYQSYGPGQQQPQYGYPATAGPQYPTGAYPRQQPYPPAGGAMPLQQRTPPVQTVLSDGNSSRSRYPPTAHAQQRTTNEPSAPLPPSYDEVVINELNKI